MKKYSFTGCISTNAVGIQHLCDFFHYANNFKNCWFELDFTRLEFIDANLSAELFLYCHILKSQNKLRFFIDYAALNTHLNVLSRNGFAYYVVDRDAKNKFPIYDERESTIPLKAFKIEDVDKFVTYIDTNFLKQRGLENIQQTDKDNIRTSYCEIFDNVGIHANADMIICCGQYFPQNNELKFTLTDYGDGFLKKIAQYVLEKEGRVMEDPKNAIDWAVKGGSTKPENIKGGNGLKSIMRYCFRKGGVLSIVSDGFVSILQSNSSNGSCSVKIAYSLN